MTYREKLLAVYFEEGYDLDGWEVLADDEIDELIDALLERNIDKLANETCPHNFLRSTELKVRLCDVHCSYARDHYGYSGNCMRHWEHFVDEEYKE